jgi:hypothetical protein
VNSGLLAEPHAKLSPGGERPPVAGDDRRPKCPDDDSRRSLDGDVRDFDIAEPGVVTGGESRGNTGDWAACAHA